MKSWTRRSSMFSRAPVQRVLVRVSNTGTGKLVIPRARTVRNGPRSGPYMVPRVGWSPMVARAEGAFETCKGAHSTALPRGLCASVAYGAYTLPLLPCQFRVRNAWICESFAAAHAAAPYGHGRLYSDYLRSGGRGGGCLCAPKNA